MVGSDAMADSAADGPHTDPWGIGRSVSLTADQERLVAETIHAGRSAAANLRFAVIPMDGLSDLALGREMAGPSWRSQDYLRRASQEWVRRGGDPAALATAAAALGDECNSVEQAGLCAAARGLSALSGAAVLLAALRLDREMIGRVRRGPSATAFIQELDRQATALAREYPPTALERLDVARAAWVARDYFIQAQMPLALRRARAVQRHSRLALCDLVQVGNEGLIKAVDNFDPRFGVPFAAYGYPWVKQGISRAERQGDLIVLPMRIQAARGAVRRALTRAASTGAAPDAGAIAAELGLEKRFVTAVMRADAPVLSLDGDAGHRIADTCADKAVLPLDEHIRIRERRVAVRQALLTCAPREREIIRRFFGIGGDPQPVAQIAQSLRVTPQRVYQLKAAEIRRLRRPAVSSNLVEHA